MSSDLELGNGPWANIAQVIRQTFLAILNKIRILNEKFKSIEALLLTDKEERVKQAELIRTLSSKQIENPNYVKAIVALEQRLQDLESQVHVLSDITPRIDDLKQVLSRKVDARVFESSIKGLMTREEIGSLIDVRAKQLETNVVEIESRMMNGLKSVSTKLSSFGELQSVKDTVTSEMLLGRWLWSANAQNVITLRETINTAQVLYNLNERGEIRIGKQGIFEFQFACFLTNRENHSYVVQVLVNNEIIFANERSSESPQNSKGSSLHSLSWSVTEILFLDEGSLIRFKFRGSPAQGVISLRNLHCSDS